MHQCMMAVAGQVAGDTQAEIAELSLIQTIHAVSILPSSNLSQLRTSHKISRSKAQTYFALSKSLQLAPFHALFCGGRNNNRSVLLPIIVRMYAQVGKLYHSPRLCYNTNFGLALLPFCTC